MVVVEAIRARVKARLCDNVRRLLAAAHSLLRIQDYGAGSEQVIANLRCLGPSCGLQQI